MTPHEPVEADEAWELPELPPLDDRYLRRAIRRGVLRTALVGAFYVVVALFVLSIGVQAILAGLGRSDQLDRLATAWHVAHPEFMTEQSGSGPTWLGRYVTFDARLLAARPDPASARVRLSQNLWGHIGFPTALPQSPAADALNSVGAANPGDLKAAETRRLQRLPAGTVTAAVIEFTQPLDQTALGGWTSGLPSALQPTLVGATFLMTDAQHDATSCCDAAVYGWDPFRDFHGTGRWTVASSFRRYVATLHDSDAGNLHLVGIDLDRLRTAARAGLVHGVIVQGLTPTALVRLLQDPQVRAAHVYDVAFQPIN